MKGAAHHNYKKRRSISPEHFLIWGIFDNFALLLNICVLMFECFGICDFHTLLNFRNQMCGNL